MEERQDDVITISFKGLFQVLWKEKWLIAAITSLFIAAGAYYAFTAREEFVSEGKILPEITGGGGSSLGGLANLIGMGGFELGLKNATEAIRPDLYPNILTSTPFHLAILDQKVTTRTGKVTTFENYYRETFEKDKEVKPGDTKAPAAVEGVLTISKLNEFRLKNLSQRVTSSIDKKSGVISISVKMPDPIVAAQLANFSMVYLTEYVKNYRTQKFQKDVDFLGEKVAAARGKYYANQEQKASYSDQFQLPTIRLQSADIKRERLESEYRMSSTLYNELLKKYEEAKFKLQQETPVFKILNPPVVPNLKSEPKKAIILVVSALLGGIIGIITSLIIRKNYKRIIM